LTRTAVEPAPSPRDTAGQEHRRICTKWARFEARPQTHFAAHRASEIHTIAFNHWMFPDEPVQLKLQAWLFDDRLLSGSVPQLED